MNTTTTSVSSAGSTGWLSGAWTLPRPPASPSPVTFGGGIFNSTQQTPTMSPPLPMSLPLSLTTLLTSATAPLGPVFATTQAGAAADVDPNARPTATSSVSVGGIVTVTLSTS